MNRKLFKNINKFYKEYDLAHPFENITFNKDDRYDHEALMTTYEDMWTTMQYDEVRHSDYYEWLVNLYGELGEYINVFDNGKKHNSKLMAIIKIFISIFCTMSVGAFIAVWIECGYDLMIVIGIILAVFVAVCSGIGTYEDIKVA